MQPECKQGWNIRNDWVTVGLRKFTGNCDRISSDLCSRVLSTSALWLSSKEHEAAAGQQSWLPLKKNKNKGSGHQRKHNIKINTLKTDKRLLKCCNHAYSISTYGNHVNILLLTTYLYIFVSTIFISESNAMEKVIHDKSSLSSTKSNRKIKVRYVSWRGIAWGQWSLTAGASRNF